MVKQYTKGQNDEKALADLVGTEGYGILKQMLIAAALQEIQVNGSKSEKAAGLATATGLIAECERAVQELSRKTAQTRDEEDTDA